MYTTQQILSLSTSISKIEQPHKDLINFSNPLVRQEFERWSDRLLNSCSKENLSHSVDEIVFILNRLPNFEYMLLSKKIDESYPSISVYFIMEGIQCYESNDSYKFFIDRLCKFRDNSLMSMYSATRAKLITELLKKLKQSKTVELLKVDDDYIISTLEEMVEDWEYDEVDNELEDESDDEPVCFTKKTSNLNEKKIYLRRALK